ncbi:hypothetical protein M3Y97_00371600 [Aphelenchoides bicaudatus]|nr:hypothetical protein M3Y97_00371600 [Aphelenchoides bicaudatus]
MTGTKWTNDLTLSFRLKASKVHTCRSIRQFFKNSKAEYIMLEGNEHGKGKFEFALSHIGWAVASGFALGCVRGFVPELMNKETRQLSGRPWVTRMVNATVKHGSGYAQPAGAAVFMYSVFEILLKNLRADDDLNSLAAGGFAGALYRSPHGFRAAGSGAGVGLALAATWLLANPDSRQRIKEMINFS